MKKEIWALMLDLKKKPSKEVSTINLETDFIQLFISLTRKTDSESFTWTVGNHMGLWATERDMDSFISTLMPHTELFDKIKLLRGSKAISHLMNIAKGLAWRDCSMPDKLSTFNNAYTFLNKKNFLEPSLLPMVEGCLEVFNQSPLMKGVQNARQFPNQDFTKENGELQSGIQILCKDLFYRFCLN